MIITWTEILFYLEIIKTFAFVGEVPGSLIGSEGVAFPMGMKVPTKGEKVRKTAS